MRYVSIFWGGRENGGMFSNSNTPFSITCSAHAVQLEHCRRGLVLKTIVLGGSNQAHRPERERETKAWVNMQQTEEGDIIYVMDVNQKLRYAMIVCVGPLRGAYDH